jgi:hypothetical protein
MMDDRRMVDRRVMDDRRMVDRRVMDDRRMVDRRVMDDRRMTDRRVMDDRSVTHQSGVSADAVSCPHRYEPGGTVARTERTRDSRDRGTAVVDVREQAAVLCRNRNVLSLRGRQSQMSSSCNR